MHMCEMRGVVPGPEGSLPLAPGVHRLAGLAPTPCQGPGGQQIRCACPVPGLTRCVTSAAGHDCLRQVVFLSDGYCGMLPTGRSDSRVASVQESAQEDEMLLGCPWMRRPGMPFASAPFQLIKQAHVLLLALHVPQLRCLGDWHTRIQPSLMAGCRGLNGYALGAGPAAGGRATGQLGAAAGSDARAPKKCIWPRAVPTSHNAHAGLSCMPLLQACCAIWHVLSSSAQQSHAAV